MAALSLSALHSPAGDWDSKLDDMLADLETGTTMNSAANNFSFQQQQHQQFSYSSSSSSSNQQQIVGGSVQQQMVGGSVQQQVVGGSAQQQHKSVSSSSARSHQAIGPKTNGGGFSLKKSASSVSLKDSAGDVLKDLENGLVKSSHYIKESHGKVVGPDGTQEWHDVQRGGEPPVESFDLEMQVQHMMPALTSYNSNQNQFHKQQQQQYNQQQSYQQQQQQLSYQQNQQSYQQNQQSYQQQNYEQDQQHQRYQPPPPQQQQQLEDTDDRPGSRLKQNIDELDNLLYDLNHARNLTPEGGTEYTDTYATGAESDDYSESVGKEGHVKRTVTAFNEFSQQMSTSPEASRKPPSPSPRRKAPTSPTSGRRAPPGAQSYFTSNQQQASQSSYMTSTQQTSSSAVYGGSRADYPSSGSAQATYSPPPSISYQSGQPGGGNHNAYPDSDFSPCRSPEAASPQPNYYTKFSSVKQASTVASSANDNKPGMRFPATSARSPTPQNMPKQVEELMSEFQEFDSTVCKSVSPKPMFSKPTTPRVEVTSPPKDYEPSLPSPAPVVRDPSPPRPAGAAPPKVKGPSVYYPPGHEYCKQHDSRGKATTILVPADPPANGNPGGVVSEGEAGSLALGSSGAVASMRVESRKERYAREEKEATQGAAMIPICLPLCCAAPCVIM